MALSFPNYRNWPWVVLRTLDLPCRSYPFPLNFHCVTGDPLLALLFSATASLRLASSLTWLFSWERHYSPDHLAENLSSVGVASVPVIEQLSGLLVWIYLTLFMSLFIQFTLNYLSNSVGPWWVQDMVPGLQRHIQKIREEGKDCSARV